MRARGLDRLLEVHAAPVELEPARLPYGVHYLLGSDRSEKPSVVPRLLRDRENGLAQQRRVLLRTLDLFGGGPLRRLHTALGLGDGPSRGRLGQLARDEEVAQVAIRHVHNVAALAEG